MKCVEVQDECVTYNLNFKGLILWRFRVLVEYNRINVTPVMILMFTPTVNNHPVQLSSRSLLLSLSLSLSAALLHPTDQGTTPIAAPTTETRPKSPPPSTHALC